MVKKRMDEAQEGDINYSKNAEDLISNAMPNISNLDKKQLVAMVSLYALKLREYMGDDVDAMVGNIHRPNKSTLKIILMLLRMQGTRKIRPYGKGTYDVCNQCGQIIKTPAILRLTIGHVKRLLAMREKATEGFIHWTQIPPVVDGSTQTNVFFTEMAYFGLVTQPPDTKVRKGRKSGLWGINQKGRDFLDGKIELPLELMVFNKEILEISDIRVKVFDIDALTPNRIKKLKQRKMAEGNTKKLI